MQANEVCFSLVLRLLLPENSLERQEIAKGQNLVEFRQTVLKLKTRFLPFHTGSAVYTGDRDGRY